MSRAITRHRALLGDDVIGAVTCTADGWTYEPSSPTADPLEWFGTEDEAEQALRDLDDRKRGERIVAAGFVGLLAAHPVLYLTGILG